VWLFRLNILQISGKTNTGKKIITSRFCEAALHWFKICMHIFKKRIFKYLINLSVTPFMKRPLYLLVLLFLMACAEKQKQHESKFYYINTCNYRDTVFTDKPSFDTAGMTIIATKEFPPGEDPHFEGYVIKLMNKNLPPDAGSASYFTKELGIIYAKSIYLPCYGRLHSTNDSIERRISDYLDHILSNPDFVIAGDEWLRYHDESLTK
jgi:hypothetical protein